MSIKLSIRSRKREQVLAEAHAALGEELDALGASLASAVTEFEGLLEDCLGDVPSWADVDRDALRSVFEAAVGDDVVTVGPRTAALVTARVEGFVRVWVAADGAEQRPDEFDEAAAKVWVAELDELAELVKSAADAGRAAAERADEELPRRLEALLEQVEEARDDGASGVSPQVQSLRERLKSGKTGAALLARQTDAEVLEEQRRRTEQLTEQWSALQQLAAAAHEIGADASGRLDKVLRAVAEAVVAAYPELRSHAGAWVKAAPLRERKPTAPPPLPTPKTAASPSAPAPSDAPALGARPPETVTEEYDREIEFVEEAVGAEESAPEERVRVDTQQPRAVLHTPVPVLPIDAPRAEVVAESASPGVALQAEPDEVAADEVAPEEAAPEEAAPKEAAADKAAHHEGAQSEAKSAEVSAIEAVPADPVVEPESSGAQTSGEAAVPKDEPGPAAAAQRSAVGVAREPAFRVSTRWEPVRGGEVAIVLAVPAIYTTVLTAAVVGHYAGVASDNPIREWPWALPVFGLLAVWALGIPAYLNWQAEWDAWRPRLLRLNERRQEGFLDLDGDAFSVAGVRIAYDGASANLRRWQEGAARGWYLRVADDTSSLELAVDASSDQWGASSVPCDEGEPEGCWRVSEAGLLALVDHLDLVP